VLIILHRMATMKL